jgi:uncharacterized iron-regulated membrane protein
LRSRASRFADSGIATALALLLMLYAGLAFGFYWLMQPTVVKNHGLAAYQPPPMTVVSNVPWTPPDDTDVNAAFALAPPAQAEQSSTPAAKPQVKPDAARPAPARQRQARPRAYQGWAYAPNRSYGFRPWF